MLTRLEESVAFFEKTYGLIIRESGDKLIMSRNPDRCTLTIGQQENLAHMLEKLTQRSVIINNERGFIDFLAGSPAAINEPDRLD